MSDGLQCVFVLLCVVLNFLREWFWSLLRVNEIKNTDWFVYSSSFFADGCCVGTNSGHYTGLQMIYHAVGLVATQNTVL